MCVTDIFTTRRHVTHMECVFRVFVGNGGNWKSVLKIEHNFIFNKNSIQKRLTSLPLPMAYFYTFFHWVFPQKVLNYIVIFCILLVIWDRKSGSYSEIVEMSEIYESFSSNS